MRLETQFCLNSSFKGVSCSSGLLIKSSLMRNYLKVDEITQSNRAIQSC